MEYQRITNGYMNKNVINNLVLNRDILMELQNQIASGKKVNRASDEVFSATTIMYSNSNLGKIDTFLKNIDTATNELETADEAVLSTLDSVHKAKELTIQALNATSGVEEMNLISNQIGQIVDQIKDLANTKFSNTYIFSGQNTGIAPYSEFTDPDNPNGPKTVQFNGSTDGSAERMIEISEGVTIPLNINGEDIFGSYIRRDLDAAPPAGVPNGTPDDLSDDYEEGSGLFRTLIKLRDELASENPNKEELRDRLGDLEEDLKTILEAQSVYGGRLSRLKVTENILEDDKINSTDLKSSAQDVDLAKAISDLKFQESAFQASLQVSAQIIQPSIMQYL